jgi:hypothetical protein
MAKTRNHYIKEAKQDDEDFRRDHKLKNPDSVKVWNVDITYSSFQGDRKQYDIKSRYISENSAIETWSPREKLEAIEKERAEFSSFDSEGNYIDNRIEYQDGINTDRRLCNS